MKNILKKNKAQTFVEFILAFTVLLIAVSGIWVLYKKVWSVRFNETTAITDSQGIFSEVKYVK
jgi:uncharacterized protein (UPF0333 family)